MLERSSLRSPPAQSPAPAPYGDAALVVAEHELHRLVIEVDELYAMWPKGKGAVERARIGRRIEVALSRVAELYRIIANAQPATLQGAAVQIRRALVMLEDKDIAVAQRLIYSALNVVEVFADEALSVESLEAGAGINQESLAHLSMGCRRRWLRV